MSAAGVILCNEALRLLGEFGVTSFEEGTDLAQSCNAIYDTTRRLLLTSHPWRFTLAKERLARLDETPASEWAYLHAAPAGMLALRALYPAAQPGAAPVRAYEIYGARILSHSEDLWADYQLDSNPDTWPAYFRQLARCALAADLAMAVGAGPGAADLMHRRAFGSPSEMMNGGLMGLARRMDSQQQPPQALRDFPLITARFGGR
jgi:hypothetical protein